MTGLANTELIAPDEYKDNPALGRLNARQRRFVYEVCVDWNYAAAARRAGYSAGSSRDRGSMLMRNENVAEAVSVIMRKTNEKALVDRGFVLKKLIGIEQKLDAKGADDMGVVTTRLRTLELIGKHVDVNAFRSNFGISGPNGEPVNQNWNLGALDDEELETFERLLAKISPALSFERGEGAPDGSEGVGEETSEP